MTPITVSPSEVDNFLLCGWRVTRAVPGRGSNQAPAWGTGMHALIESFLRGENGVETIEEVLDLWVEAMLTHPKHPEDIRDYADDLTLTDLASEMLGGFHLWEEQWYRPNHDMLERRGFTPEQTAERMHPEPTDNGTPILIRGTADLILSDPLGGRDFKTHGGKGWDETKVNSGSQHILYPWLVNPDFDELDFGYVVYSRQNREWKEHPVTVTREMVDATLRQVQIMATQIENDTAMPNPVGEGWGGARGWYCSPLYCDAWSVCDAKYKINDGKADQVQVEIKW